MCSITIRQTVLTAAADHVRQLGTVRLSLNTDVQNLPAQALYASMGWEREIGACKARGTELQASSQF